MKPSELFEAPPQHTFPTEFGLADDERNTAVTKEWLTDKRKQPLEKFDNGRFTLYELPRAFILVDYEDQYKPKLVYSMQFTLVFHKFIGRQCAQQIAVWRDETSREAKGMAGHIFQDYLLPKFNNVITDAMQTEDGQRFWGERIADALAFGQYVYYFNLLPTREVVQIHSVNEFKALRANKEIWGNNAKHQARRIVIATSEIL